MRESPVCRFTLWHKRCYYNSLSLPLSLSFSLSHPLSSLFLPLSPSFLSHSPSLTLFPLSIFLSVSPSHPLFSLSFCISLSFSLSPPFLSLFLSFSPPPPLSLSLVRFKNFHVQFTPHLQTCKLNLISCTFAGRCTLFSKHSPPTCKLHESYKSISSRSYRSISSRYSAPAGTISI